jgi:serine/threonine protein kinase
MDGTEKPELSALEAGTYLNNRYHIQSVLGKGGFGITYQVYDTRSRKKCVVKEYVPSDLMVRPPKTKLLEAKSVWAKQEFLKGMKSFREEIRILNQLSDMASVVHILDFFLENGTIYYVMEYLEGETFQQQLRKTGDSLRKETILRRIISTGEALETLHKKKGILHRDISPENIFLVKGETVKLIDFGSAVDIKGLERADGTITLKLAFAAPEQYGSATRQGFYTDVYALAASCYYALTGIRLPEAPERQKGKPYLPLVTMKADVGREVSQAVDRALQLDPERRTADIGRFLSDISSAAKHMTVGKPYIEVLTGPRAGLIRNLLPDRTIRLGRLLELCDIAFEEHEEVSKLHCTIAWKPMSGCFLVVDQSANGTYIGTKRIRQGEESLADPGSCIALASNACMVKVGMNDGGGNRDGT